MYFQNEDKLLSDKLSIWLPVVFIAVHPVVWLLTDNFSDWFAIMRGEHGLVENLTVLFAVIGVVYGIKSLKYRNVLNLSTKLVIYGIILFGIVIAGEETSWGQWYLQWETPDAWKAVNLQQETNLHNLHRYYTDRYPKVFIQIILFIGCCVLPFVINKKPQFFINKQIFFWLIPNKQLFLAAILSVTATIPKQLLNNLGVIENHSNYDLLLIGKESKECMIVMTYMLYSILLNKRLKKYAPAI